MTVDANFWKGVASAMLLTLAIASIAAGLIAWLGYWGVIILICAATLAASWLLRNRL